MKRAQLAELLQRAAQRRREPAVRAGIGVGTDVYRLVHGDADGVPDVIVDRYGAVVRIELYNEALAARASEIADALVACGEGQGGVVCLVRARRARDSRLFVERGEVPTAHVVHEDGARYLVRTAQPDAVGTGLFTDHREGRRLVRAHARAARVMNLFAHAGGFGVAAVTGGAARVDHVDAARKCARWGAYNYALNGVDPRRHRFLVDDAFRVLARAARRGGELDVLVCDPPTTGIDPKGKRFKTRERLDDLAESGVRALADGGLYVLSTNDRSVSPARIVAALRDAADREGRAVARVHEVALGPDLPAGGERLRPMRGAAMKLAS